MSKRTKQRAAQFWANPPIWAKGVVLLIVLEFFFGISMKPVVDYDLFFQMLVGAKTWEDLKIPPTEFYIYTALGEKAHFSGWLFGLMHHWVWLKAGFLGNTLLNALIWTGALGGAVCAALKGLSHTKITFWGKIAAALLATGLVFQGIAPRMLMRAECTLYLAWGCALYSCAWSRSRAQAWHLGSVGYGFGTRGMFLNPWAPMLSIPLLAWILSWFHTTSLFMVGLLAALGMDLVFQVLLAKKDPSKYEQPATGWITFLPQLAILSFVLMLSNPYGMKQSLPHVLALMARVFHPASAATAGAGGTGMLNIEYAPILSTGQALHFYYLIVCALLCVLINKGRRTYDLILLMGFSLLAYWHARNMGLLAFALIEPLTIALGRMSAQGSQKIKYWIPRFGQQIVIGTVSVSLLTGGALVWVASMQGPGGIGSGIYSEFFPENCSKRLHERYPQGARVFNFHHMGSYLAWASRGSLMPAIDGHFTTDTHAWPRYTQAYFAKPAEFLKIMDDDQVVAAVLPSVVPYVGGYVEATRTLVKDPNWIVVGRDPTALCLARRGAGEAKDFESDKKEYWLNVQSEALMIFKTASLDPENAFKRAQFILQEATNALKYQ